MCIAISSSSVTAWLLVTREKGIAESPGARPPLGGRSPDRRPGRGTDPGRGEARRELRDPPDHRRPDAGIRGARGGDLDEGRTAPILRGVIPRPAPRPRPGDRGAAGAGRSSRCGSVLGTPMSSGVRLPPRKQVEKQSSWPHASLDTIRSARCRGPTARCLPSAPCSVLNPRRIAVAATWSLRLTWPRGRSLREVESSSIGSHREPFIGLRGRPPAALRRRDHPQRSRFVGLWISQSAREVVEEPGQIDRALAAPRSGPAAPQ